MQDIPGYNGFIHIEEIKKGWSNDKKYYVETSDGKRLMLRIADQSEYSIKKAEYEQMQQVFALGIPMSEPIDFGLCSGGEQVYMLLTWRDGEDAERVLPLLTETEQYVLGVQSGEMLKKIHSIPAPAGQEEWEVRFNRKTDMKINTYLNCGTQFDGDKEILHYLNENRNLLKNRPQCYQHGDYHVGNMIIDEHGRLSIIDFNRFDYGDPWEEWNRIVFSATISPCFATGQLVGYFGGRPTMEFFRLLAFYIASNTLSAIYWAMSYGQREMDTMLAQAADVMEWFDGMANPVPSWFIEDFYVQYIDGMPYKMKEAFDFSFIKKYGTVFKIYDDQDSGNICFGTEQGGKRYFVKFAGAPTARLNGSSQSAIERLEQAVKIYEDLAHGHLIRLIQTEKIGGGFAAIFAWTDGDCLGRMYPKSRMRFLEMPIESKMKVYEDVLEFHAFVHENGYVAIDFYDGSILYDLDKEQTKICDIDFYEKKPYINTVGRLFGSSRFMSPEEYTMGAKIDEITNVYTMGATAFALFGDDKRTKDAWQLHDALYYVALRAVSDERGKRQQSIRQLIRNWRSHF